MQRAAASSTRLQGRQLQEWTLQKEVCLCPCVFMTDAAVLKPILLEQNACVVLRNQKVVNRQFVVK